jgi:hypothetical protein
MKRWLWAVLAVVVVAGACGGGEGSHQTRTSTSSSTTSGADVVRAFMRTYRFVLAIRPGTRGLTPTRSFCVP